MSMGRDFGINGTPTIVFTDGSRGAGALPVDARNGQLMSESRLGKPGLIGTPGRHPGILKVDNHGHAQMPFDFGDEEH
jgi:hypothetical protein